jgi:type I restriction enzyme M protein
VKNFQDCSLARSHQTDLYQLVFYNFAQPFQKGDKAQFLTPLPIIEFLVKVVNPRGNESVCDPCVGIADFLSLSYVNANPKLDDNNLYGIDIDSQVIALAQLNMLLNGDGNCHLLKADDKGSILHKVKFDGSLIPLIPTQHKYSTKEKTADWDNWADNTRLMKFNVVLTNPPFGRGRTYEVKNNRDKEIAEMYETYWIKGRPEKSMDLGVLFLENAYHVIAENGRMGIIVSNAIASEEQWLDVMKWFMERMRVVALFDLPSEVFAETGVNTTLIIAYKPKKDELETLKGQNYEIFIKDVNKVGYKKTKVKKNIVFNPLYKIDFTTFDIMIDENGSPILDEEFTQTIKDFRNWATSQEETLQKLFVL